MGNKFVFNGFIPHSHQPKESGFVKRYFEQIRILFFSSNFGHNVNFVIKKNISDKIRIKNIVIHI